MKTYLYIFLLVLFFGACKKKEEAGPNIPKPYYYFEMDFQGEHIRLESDEPLTQGSGSGAKITGLHSELKNGSQFITPAIFFKDSIIESDIISLQGKNLYMRPEDGYPYLTIGFYDPYKTYFATYMENFDYGAYEIVVDTVIRGNYFQPFHYPVYQTQAFIVRGRCEFNFSKNFSIVGRDDTTLYPVTNGRFSIIAFVTQ